MLSDTRSGTHADDASWSEIDVNNVAMSMAPKPNEAGAKHGREEEDVDIEEQKKPKN